MATADHLFVPGLVSVLVPAYDEQATIAEVVARVLDQALDVEVLVVDDGSTDATAARIEAVAAEDPRVRLLRHPANRGKGAAVRTALAASRGEVVVIQDADVEYDPSDLPDVVGPILTGRADVVFGTRLRGGRLQRAHMFWHYAGNHALSLLTRVVFNTTLSDVEVGTKAFYGPLLRGFDLHADDFRFEIEVAAHALRTPGIRIFETPVSYYGRSYEEGKKITWVDGLRALQALVRFARVTNPPLQRPASQGLGGLALGRDAHHVPRQAEAL